VRTKIWIGGPAEAHDSTHQPMCSVIWLAAHPALASEHDATMSSKDSSLARLRRLQSFGAHAQQSCLHLVRAQVVGSRDRARLAPRYGRSRTGMGTGEAVVPPRPS